MGLYDDRLSDLSEARRRRRVAGRRGSLGGIVPAIRRAVRPLMRPFIRPSIRPVHPGRPATEVSASPSMRIQSLLFGRDAGWTESSAKAWAKSHGYKHGKVDITDQYVRIRQFDPRGLKVKRTKTLGRGIRAVVAREEDMGKRRSRTTRKTKEASRRRRSLRARTTTAAAPRGRTRRVRSTAVAAPRRRRRRMRAATRRAGTGTIRARARNTRSRVAAPRRRRRRVHARRVRETIVAAPRRRRRRRHARAREATRVAAPRRRRRRHVRAWHGNTPGHRKAAKKGHSRRRSRRARETTRVAAPRRRRAARRVRETSKYVASPRRRRRRRHHSREAVRTVRSNRRRSYRANASLSSIGTKAGKLAIGILSAGVGFALADGLDRFLATYNPAGAEQPKNKFTSDGNGTLANTLNIASPPHLVRIGAAVGSIVVPAAVAMYVKNGFVKSSLEGMALGAGVKAFSTLWSNVLMPMLAPKGDKATTEALQKSHIVRLYPAEVAAKMNIESQTRSVSSSGSGALSAPPPDVGPFALAGSSPYPDTAQALRRQAGLDGDSPYPSAGQALQHQAGVGYRPPPPHVNRPASPVVNQWRDAHPGFRPGGNALAARWSQRWGNTYNAAVPAAPLVAGGPVHHHHHCMLRAKTMYPTYTDQQLHAWCMAHPHSTHPYLYEAPAPTAVQYGAVSDPPDAGAPPDAPPPDAAPPPAAPPPPSDPVGPPSYAPGPGSSAGPGPQPLSDCGCVGDDNKFLGFIGDEEEKDVFINGLN